MSYYNDQFMTENCIRYCAVMQKIYEEDEWYLGSLVSVIKEDFKNLMRECQSDQEFYDYYAEEFCPAAMKCMKETGIGAKEYLLSLSKEAYDMVKLKLLYRLNYA